MEFQPGCPGYHTGGGTAAVGRGRRTAACPHAAPVAGGGTRAYCTAGTIRRRAFERSQES